MEAMKTIAQIALAILVFAVIVLVRHQLSTDKRLDRLEKASSNDWIVIKGTNWPIILYSPMANRYYTNH